MFTAATNLPFPQIPKVFLDSLNVLLQEQSIFRANDVNNSNFQLRRICADRFPDLIFWVKKNVTENFHKIHLQTINDGNYFDPHIDPVSNLAPERHYNLMYLFETGGDCVETCFYYTPPDTLDKCKQSGKFTFNYNEVSIISKFCFQKNTWNFMNNQCIHSVEGISSTRMGVALSFYDTTPPKFLQDFLK